MVKETPQDKLKYQLEKILGIELTQEEFEECLRNLALLGQALFEYYQSKVNKNESG